MFRQFRSEGGRRARRRARLAGPPDRRPRHRTPARRHGRDARLQRRLSARGRGRSATRRRTWPRRSRTRSTSTSTGTTTWLRSTPPARTSTSTPASALRRRHARRVRGRLGLRRTSRPRHLCRRRRAHEREPDRSGPRRSRAQPHRRRRRREPLEYAGYDVDRHYYVTSTTPAARWRCSRGRTSGSTSRT